MQRLLTSSSLPPLVLIYYSIEICYLLLYFLLSLSILCGAAWSRPSVGVAKIMDNHNTSIVPYHDPFDDDDDDDDSSSFVNISLFDENPTIDGGDHPPPLDENPTNLNSDFGVSDYDPILLDISYECSNHLVGNSTNAEVDVLGNSNNNLHNCQILREITHADGQCVYLLNFSLVLGNCGILK